MHLSMGELILSWSKLSLALKHSGKLDIEDLTDITLQGNREAGNGSHTLKCRPGGKSAHIVAYSSCHCQGRVFALGWLCAAYEGKISA